MRVSLRQTTKPGSGSMTFLGKIKILCMFEENRKRNQMILVIFRPKHKIQVPQVISQQKRGRKGPVRGSFGLSRSSVGPLQEVWRFKRESLEKLKKSAKGTTLMAVGTHPNW